MRILITGGAGFLGSHLTDRFLSEGHEVTVLDNLITGRLENISQHYGNPRFQFIKHDVTTHIHIPYAIDAVLHFASPASPKDFPAIPIPILKVNSLGTHNALGLALTKQARFLLASTSEVYGDPLVHPQPESYWGNVNPIGIRGVYDESKRFAEAITMAYRRAHQLDTRIVRIFNTYGPRMRLDDGRVIPNFVGQALRAEPLTVYGDGSQTRSFCYVDDEIEGFQRLLMSDEPGPINIGNTTETTMLELAELVNRLTGNRAGILFKPLPIDDPKVRQPDISKARQSLDWEPTIELKEGLARTITWFRDQIEMG
ncbi:MAG: SDR family oxidoreductase [Chloroflexi bacterium]|nr:SDR family oxidoreductase [Chloroflexota bacterium]